MSDSDAQLLVPIKVEALVIDPSPHHRALDRKWSASGSSLPATVQTFAPTGPPLFMGATLDGFQQQWDAAQCGIYLHWVLPPGMRHAHGYPHNALAFPPLPDQWLVVRFWRGGDPDAPVQVRAWFVDAGVLDAADTATHVLGPSTDGTYLDARPIGRAVPFPEEYDPAEFNAAERATITALGSAHTGSPTFSAFTADNRNVLSFHDDLDGDPTDKLALSYLVLGWYRAEATADEPLAYVRRRLAQSELEKGEKTAVLRALGWQWNEVALPEVSGAKRLTADEEKAAIAAAEAALPDDLLTHRALFHGMVAHVNYFDAEAYRGPLLGYPNAPPAHGGSRETHETISVGIGNNAADALIALVADLADKTLGGTESGDDQGKAALWKALEAVVYRRRGSLLQGWKESPRQHAVHQAWFSPQDGGLQWNMTARERTDATDQEPTASTAELENLTEWLAYLNTIQSTANRKAQDLAALQQEFYARWWLLLRRRYTGEDRGPTEDQLLTALDNFTNQLTTLQSELDEKRTAIAETSDALRESANTAGLELRQEAAPRFWMPTDPVIVVHNAGTLEKHTFPNPLRCRSAVNTQSVRAIVGDERFSSLASDGDDFDAIMNALPHLPAGFGLAHLLLEAHQVEQALYFVAKRGAVVRPLDDESAWQAWSDFLHHTLAGWDDDSSEQKKLRASFPASMLAVDTADNDAALLPRLVQFWQRQPWSPLYLDWQVTWYPDEQLGSDFSARWQVEGDAVDYRPKKGSALAQGIVVRGRSLMAPQMGRVFTAPIDELRRLLDGESQSEHGIEAQVAAVLASYAAAWKAPLEALETGGLLGQALSGFHQTLLGRELAAPRFMPHPTYPWMPPSDASAHGDYSDRAVLDAGLLDPPHLLTVDQAGQPQDPARAVVLPTLAPPTLAPPAPFGLLKGGALHVDALWIVDDFGQWCDLPVDATRNQTHNLVVSPHSHWPGSNSALRIAQPPRVLQPARLHFRFVDGDFAQASSGHRNSNPVRGWLFHNYLDHSLTLCDAEGNLLGELALVKEPVGLSVRWECLQAGQPIDAALEDVVEDATLCDFAAALLDETPRAEQRLQALLALIDDALGTIRPSSTDNRLRVAGRPLALVNARLGMELFGRAWRAPLQATTAAMTGSGAAVLDALRLPVQLGQGDTVEDGLIGYYKRSDPQAGMEQIVAVRQPEAFQDTTGYLGDANPAADAVRVGFGHLDDDGALSGGGWQLLTLLMDPFGAVHAGVGMLPVESVSLPKVYLDHARENMEVSFRVAPVLVRPSATDQAAAHGPSLRLPVALPAGQRGRWRFVPPDGDERRDVLPPTRQPDYGPAPLRAVEGRLALDKEDDL